MAVGGLSFELRLTRIGRVVVPVLRPLVRRLPAGVNERLSTWLAERMSEVKLNPGGRWTRLGLLKPRRP